VGSALLHVALLCVGDAVACVQRALAAPDGLARQATGRLTSHARPHERPPWPEAALPASAWHRQRAAGTGAPPALLNIVTHCCTYCCTHRHTQLHTATWSHGRTQPHTVTHSCTQLHSHSHTAAHSNIVTQSHTATHTCLVS